MQNHRVWIAATFVWLFTLFNIERIYEPVNLASFVYALATLGSVSLLVLRPLRDLPLRWTASAALLTFFVTKCFVGYTVSFATLPITLVEAVAIAGTMFLAHRIGRHADAFTDTTAELLQTIRGRNIPALTDVEPDMQREMRRARRYERPLAIVTVRPRDPSLGAALHLLVAQLEQDLVNRYSRGRLAEVLLDETKSNDLVAWDGDQFVIMLPETDRNQAVQMLSRVTGRIESLLKFQVATGLADFPNDEITWAGLLESATHATPDLLDEIADELTDAEVQTAEV